jgi:hypothetical protein
MTFQIYNDGTDQYVRVEAIKIGGGYIDTNESGGELVDGDALPGARLIYSEYKISDSPITDPEVVYVASVGMFQAKIPFGYIQNNGSATLIVTGTNMMRAVIPLEVTTLTANVVPVLISPDIHPLGGTRKHSFNIYDEQGSPVNTCTNPVISCAVNGAAETSKSWTISSYNNTMSRFSVTVVDPGWTHGDLIECNIMCDEGTGYFYLKVVDLTVRSKLLTMALGNHTGLTNGEGNPTVTLTGVGTAVWTVDSNGNRSLTSINLV